MQGMQGWRLGGADDDGAARPVAEESGIFSQLQEALRGGNPWYQNPLYIGGASGCCGLLVIFCFMSLGTVPPLYYGIRYNQFNKYADVDHPHTSGRYFIGPWNTFVLFPATVQTVEFASEVRVAPQGYRYPPLHTRTQEGLALHLQVSLQYKLILDSVGQLYKEFNRNYHDLFLASIRDTLIESAAEYEASQLWKERQAVGDAMQTKLTKKLKPTHAECWGLQLLVIDLPDSFDAAIVHTQVQRQNWSTMTNAQRAVEISSTTEVIESEFDRNVTVLHAQGQANYSLQTKKAKGKAKSKTFEVEADVLDNIRSSLGIQRDDLVEYQNCISLKMLQNASMLYGFEGVTPMLLGGGTASAATTRAQASGGRRLANSDGEEGPMSSKPLGDGTLPLSSARRRDSDEL